MSIWSRTGARVAQALSRLAPSPPPEMTATSPAAASAAADAASPASADERPRRGGLGGMLDSAMALFAGRFFQQQEPVATVGADGWEPRTPYADHTREMLGRVGLPRRALATRAFDATREGWSTEFSNMDAGLAATATKRLASQQDRLGVRAAFFRALFRAEQHGESIMVIGVDDGQRLDLPLDLTSVRRVLWLKVFGRHEYTIPNMSSGTAENFGKPESYNIFDFHKPELVSLQDAPRETGSVIVHHSRVLRFATEDGHSRLDEWAAAFEDYYSATRSGRKAAGLFSIFAYYIDNWFGKVGADEPAAVSRVSLQHLGLQRLGALILDRQSEDVKHIASPATGLADLIDRAVIRILLETGYPGMVLAGSDPAGFSSGEEVIRRYYDEIRAWQSLRIEPQLRRLLEILMVSEDGPDNLIVAPEDWAVKFNPLRVLTAKEVAELRKLMADTIKLLKDAQIIDRSEARESLPRGAEVVPDVKLSPEPIVEQNTERMEVGIVQALAKAVTEFYAEGNTTPAEPMRALFASVVPELKDVVSLMFDRSLAAQAAANVAPLGAAAGGLPSDAPAGGPVPGDTPVEAWIKADDAARQFAVSRRTLARLRAPVAGDVEPPPGRLRWIKPDGRLRYKLSEVRRVLEATPLRPKDKVPDEPFDDPEDDSDGPGTPAPAA